MLLTVVFVIFTSLILAYAFIRKQYQYWANRGVYYVKPEFPMGNFKGMGKTLHPAEITKNLYDKSKGKGIPFLGMYVLVSPTVLVIDPELSKNILVRDFEYFRNRGFYYNETDDPISAHLFAHEDKKWKDLRAKLSPTFTSGKMKMMFGTMLDIANNMVDYMKPIAEREETFDIKDIVSRYSTDVIGSCAFGVECNSIRNPDAEFRVYGRDIFNPGPVIQYKLLLGNIFPNLSRKLGICATPRHISDFFIGVVKDTTSYRRKNNVERKDFMQLLLEIQNKNELTDLEIAAQSFLFFAAGFETSGSTMTFALFELARHQDFQQRLRNEINTVLKKYNNEITYEATNEMPYLNLVIDETLRQYPPIDTLFRRSTRDYKVPGSNYTIEKNTLIMIPVYGIQHDPDIYPEPEKFDPDRFLDENKAKRHPFAYLPFGEGPRNCIGLRFGIMQTRLGLISILRNFNVNVCADTPTTITFEKTTTFLSPSVPIILKLTPLAT